MFPLLTLDSYLPLGSEMYVAFLADKILWSTKDENFRSQAPSEVNIPCF